ncbi:MAG: glycosyltransferase [Roseiarcus sp.]
MTEAINGAADALREKLRKGPAHKFAIFQNAERMAGKRAQWIAQNEAYHGDDRRYLGYIIPKGARVIDLGCGDGSLLASLEPSRGVGVDFSPRMIETARAAHPNLEFVLGDIEDPETLVSLDGEFDFLVMSDTIGMLEDIEQALGNLHRLCTPATRVVIAYFSPMWGPLIDLATTLGLRMPQPKASLISSTDFLNIMDLTRFEAIRIERRQLAPMRVFGIDRFINRYIAPLPGLRQLCLRTYLVARSLEAQRPREMSTTVLIPCRNERGNIERAILEMPRFGGHQEIVFVEGNSKDGTYEECLRVQEAYKDQWHIEVYKQDGRGKGDAVRKGFDKASCDILMILDADLTVPPAALPKFYRALASGKGEFINGTRLVYPMENEAMRPLNYIANRAFAKIFSYLLNQRFTDTLCGTKALTKAAYLGIVADRKYFGDFDPFGDFDLIFGAAKQSLRIIEAPVHYKARVYGETQISRFRDGWLLLRMVVFAYKKLKAI